MMHSMTGFGRAEYSTPHYQAMVEISSVNRKNAEIVLQMPKPLLSLEAGLKKSISTQFQRGRLQVSLTLTQLNKEEADTLIDEKALDSLISISKKVEEKTGTPQPILLSDIINMGNIISLDKVQLDPELAIEAIAPAISLAMEEMLKMRKLEGEHMQSDILEKISFLEKQVEQIKSHAPQVITHYRQALLQRLAEANTPIDLDDERILKEISIFTERCDISEEVTRLASHFLKFREYLDNSDAVGRSLDFLCQEMNREFNTIGSKANDSTLAHLIVTCKNELEKAREQIQNIE